MDSCYSSGLSSSLSSKFTKRKAFRRTPMNNNNKRIIKKKRISSTARHPLSTLALLCLIGLGFVQFCCQLQLLWPTTLCRPATRRSFGWGGVGHVFYL
ncbi:hypothetical protein T07_4651 [Trichinella nelsoni]|uniref:Uncharacterized protein n=1 Tax=Trichinella nelsoni TaxID=6336 RepID=A0A0V0SFX0_9BILA|nr:hypothetical protein T07_4651 [Trichinella nelsoni]